MVDLKISFIEERPPIVVGNVKIKKKRNNNIFFMRICLDTCVQQYAVEFIIFAAFFPLIIDCVWGMYNEWILVIFFFSA